MSNELLHLTEDQAWAFISVAAQGDEALVKAIRTLPMEARHELAGLGMHGRKDDSPGFRACVEFYSEAGLPPSYRPPDIQKGLEKLGVTAPSGAAPTAMPAVPVAPVPEKPAPPPEGHAPPTPQVAVPGVSKIG